MDDPPLLLPTDLPGKPIAVDDLVVTYRQALALDPVHQARVLWWAMHYDPGVEASTVARVGAVIARFAARQHTLGRTRLDQTSREDAVGFIWARTRRGADPAIATVHLRRTALRIAFRMLNQLDGPFDDPTAGITLPPKTRAEVRPLDDNEIVLLRIAATGRTRGRLLAMATVALAETTATTGEIAAIRWRDVDLDTGTVDLPGAGRVRARAGTLTAWGLGAVAQLHASTGAPDGIPVVYRGRAVPGSQPSQASVVNRLTTLLTLAGLDGSDVRPSSVRLWPAARLLAEGGRLEAAAKLLGLSSLDVTAAQLGYDWQAR